MFSCLKQWLLMFKPHTWNMNAFLHACGLLVIWLVLTWLQTTKLICLQFLDNIFILPTSVGCMSIANLHMNNWCVGVMDNTFCKSKENHGKISTLIWLLIWTDTYIGVVHGLGVDLRMGIKRTCLEQINRNVGSRTKRVEL